MNSAFSDIRANLGLSDTPSDWTYAEAQAYRQAISTYIVNNPGEFSSGQISTAISYGQGAANGTQNLADDSFSLSDFISGVEDNVINASNQVGGVGRGILAALGLTSWLIPLALVVVVIIALWAFKEKVA